MSEDQPKLYRNASGNIIRLKPREEGQEAFDFLPEAVISAADTEEAAILESTEGVVIHVETSAPNPDKKKE